MRTWIANWWLSFTMGFLLVPRPFFVAGVGARPLVPTLDHAWGRPLKTTPNTAGSTLAACCGAMFTSTRTVFSTTCVALSITSTQLGPRLLLRSLSLQVTQVAIGICLAADPERGSRNRLTAVQYDSGVCTCCRCSWDRPRRHPSVVRRSQPTLRHRLTPKPSSTAERLIYA